MAEPSKKSESMEELLDELLGVSRRDTIRSNLCTMCGKSALLFRDALSEKEYTISGMCQECQDEVFGK